jgi:hypothetical protein
VFLEDTRCNMPRHSETPVTFSKGETQRIRLALGGRTKDQQHPSCPLCEGELEVSGPIQGTGSLGQCGASIASRATEPPSSRKYRTPASWIPTSRVFSRHVLSSRCARGLWLADPRTWRHNRAIALTELDSKRRWPSWPRRRSRRPPYYGTLVIEPSEVCSHGPP